MKRWKKILIWIVGAALLLVSVVVGMFYYSLRPTTGPRIEEYAPRPAPRCSSLTFRKTTPVRRQGGDTGTVTGSWRLPIR